METNSGWAGSSEVVSRNWGWFLAGGIAFILLGILALIYAVAATLATVAVFGWVLVVSGFIHVIQAFQGRGWSGFLLHLFAGILEAIVGGFIATAPGASALAITVLVAAYLLVGGLFRVFGALTLAFEGSGWMALGGLVSVLLGMALWWQWPVSGFWFIGTCVGVDLILQGATWTSVALAARRRGEQGAGHGVQGAGL